MHRDIFISYSRKDLELVKQIKEEIEDAIGIECWMDINGIESGSAQFTHDIVEGIDNCLVFLFMLSESSQKSKYALKELNYAYDEAEIHKKKVVIININGCKMMGEFKFMYSLSDTILWKNRSQHDKLIRDLRKWVGPVNELWDEPEELKEIELSLFRDDGMFGFKDYEGNIVIPAKWDDAKDFTEGLACVCDPDNGKYGFIDKNSHVILSCKWRKAGSFNNGLAPVKDRKNKWGFIDKAGRLVIQCNWNSVSPFKDGLSLVQDEKGKHGFVNESDELVIPCIWELASSFVNGLASVANDKIEFGCIDTSGNVIIPLKWNDALVRGDGFIDVSNEKKQHGLLDTQGTIHIPCKWNHIGLFSEGLAIVEDNSGMFGYTDKSGNLVIPCIWKSADSFSNGIAKVEDKNGKPLLIDKSGKTLEYLKPALNIKKKGLGSEHPNTKVTQENINDI